MSDYHNNCFGLDGIIALVVVASLFNNGNGGGLFGGGNSNIPAQTSALVEQDRMNAQVAANGADLKQLLGIAGGTTDAVVRGFDGVRTSLGGLERSLYGGQRDILEAIKDCCCANQKATDAVGDRILAWLNNDRDRKQQAEISDLKAEKSNWNQTREIEAYIDKKIARLSLPNYGNYNWNGCGNGCGNADAMLNRFLLQRGIDSLTSSATTAGTTT